MAFEQLLHPRQAAGWPHVQIWRRRWERAASTSDPIPGIRPYDTSPAKQPPSAVLLAVAKLCRAANLAPMQIDILSGSGERVSVPAPRSSLCVPSDELDDTGYARAMRITHPGVDSAKFNVLHHRAGRGGKLPSAAGVAPTTPEARPVAPRNFARASPATERQPQLRGRVGHEPAARTQRVIVSTGMAERVHMVRRWGAARS